MKRIFIAALFLALFTTSSVLYAGDQKTGATGDPCGPGCIDGKFHLGLSTTAMELDIFGRNSNDSYKAASSINFRVLQINFMPLYNPTPPVTLSIGGGITNNVLLDFTAAVQIASISNRKSSSYSSSELYAGFLLGAHVEYLFFEGRKYRPIVGLDVAGGLVSTNDDTERDDAKRQWNIECIISGGERFFVSKYVSIDLAGYIGYMHVGYDYGNKPQPEPDNGVLLGLKLGVSGWL